MLANDNVSDSVLEDVRYCVSTLHLPLNIIVLNMENICDYRLDILLMFDYETQVEIPIQVNYEHRIVLSDFASHIKNPIRLNASYILLKILPIILNNYKIEIFDIIIAVLSLLEIFEYKPDDFIKNSRLDELNDEIRAVFKNSSVLFVAGRTTEFRDEFAIGENGTIENNKVEITYDLRRFHFLQIDKLRFDPHNEQCAISNCEFTLEYADGELLLLDEYILNDSFTKNDKVYFLHDDPNIIFKPCNKINPTRLHCSFILESLESTPYFKQQNSVKEVREHYQLLLETGKLGGWCVQKKEVIDVEQTLLSDKKVFIFLGPKSAGLDKLNNYFLDHSGELINNKIIYPTHQREFFNRNGRGSIYSLFSLRANKFIIFDEHKAKCLQTDILVSKFKTLILASEDFFVDDRLLSCSETFVNARYVYYFRDSLEFSFAKYKNDVCFNKCKDKFDTYILAGCAQIKYFFSAFKYLSPGQLILREFIDDVFENTNKIIEDSSNIFGCKLLVPEDRSYEFDLRKISFIALEFRRLINFYTFMDDKIVCFIQHALLKYPQGVCDYIFLSNEQEKSYNELFRKKLERLFEAFNYSEGLKTLNSIRPKVKKCINQHIVKENINDVMMFLQKKDDDMYLRLVIELKLSRDVVTDNEEFNQFIESL